MGHSCKSERDGESVSAPIGVCIEDAQATQHQDANRRTDKARRITT